MLAKLITALQAPAMLSPTGSSPGTDAENQ
jgi:hypothetical protein